MVTNKWHETITGFLQINPAKPLLGGSFKKKNKNVFNSISVSILRWTSDLSMVYFQYLLYACWSKLYSLYNFIP